MKKVKEMLNEQKSYNSISKKSILVLSILTIMVIGISLTFQSCASSSSGEELTESTTEAETTAETTSTSTTTTESQEAALKNSTIWKKLGESSWNDYTGNVFSYGESSTEYKFSSDGSMNATEINEVNEVESKTTLVSFDDSSITYKFSKDFLSAPNGTIVISTVENSNLLQYTKKTTDGKSYSGLMCMDSPSSADESKRDVDYVLDNYWNGAKYIGSKTGKNAGIVSFGKESSDDYSYCINGTIGVDHATLDYTGYFFYNDGPCFYMSQSGEQNVNIIIIEYINKESVNAFIFEADNDMIQETWTVQ